jgi:hypothetical protein
MLLFQLIFLSPVVGPFVFVVPQPVVGPVVFAVPQPVLFRTVWLRVSGAVAGAPLSSLRDLLKAMGAIWAVVILAAVAVVMGEGTLLSRFARMEVEVVATFEFHENPHCSAIARTVCLVQTVALARAWLGASTVGVGTSGEGTVEMGKLWSLLRFWQLPLLSRTRTAWGVVCVGIWVLEISVHAMYSTSSSCAERCRLLSGVADLYSSSPYECPFCFLGWRRWMSPLRSSFLFVVWSRGLVSVCWMNCQRQLSR